MNDVFATSTSPTPCSRCTALKPVTRQPSARSRFVTAILAWIGLLVLCQWLWTKIKFEAEGAGWLLLPAFGLCVAVVAQHRVNHGERVVLNKSAACTAIFLVYFFTRLAVDSRSSDDFLGYSLSYTMGIMFALPLGMMTRVLLDAAMSTGTGPLCRIGAAVFFAFNFFSVVHAQIDSRQRLSPGEFFELTGNEAYQSAGAMASWIAMISSAIVAKSTFEADKRGSPVGVYVALGLALLLLLLLVQHVQSIGSNAGPAFTVPFALLLCGIMLTPFGRRVINPSLGRSVRLKIRLLPRIRIVLTISAVAAAAMALLLWAAVLWGALDLTEFRAFGFDRLTLANDSVTSRIHLFTHNFVTHFASAPMFGDMFVDSRLTGPGSYAHSLLAVLPHLGIVGTVLFCAMLASVLVQLKVAWNNARSSPRALRFAMLSLAAVVWAVLYVTMTSFFTSSYLWLPLGLFAPAFQIVGRPTPQSCARS